MSDLRLPGAAAAMAIWLLAGSASAQSAATPAPQASNAPYNAAPAPPATQYRRSPPAYPPPYPYPYAYSYVSRPPPNTPEVLPYHDGERVPPGYYLEQSVRRGPVIAGSIVFGVAYTLGLSIAGGNNFSNQSGWLALPVAGPWLALAQRRDSCSSNSTFGGCVDSAIGGAWARTGLVMDGLAQATGAALFIWGVTSHTRRLVRDDVARVEILPTTVGSGYGVGAFGRF